MANGFAFHLNNQGVKRLDWNKTKTMFIVVFAILNVFLYSLYLNQYNEAQNVRVLGETSIEDSLKHDNISYGPLPEYPEEMSYVSADTAPFSKSELSKYKNQEFVISEETILYATLEEPYMIKNARGDYQFPDFLTNYVPYGEEYLLWEVVEENQFALFFQKVEEYPIYFNYNAMLIVYWDDKGNITHYEQQRFGEFDSFNKKKDILSPRDVINTLYSRDYLKKDSSVTSISLGYSTLITLTQTQVFAPTWRVRVELKDGEIEDHFVNAIEGKMVEFQQERNENVVE